MPATDWYWKNKKKAQAYMIDYYRNHKTIMKDQSRVNRKKYRLCIHEYIQRYLLTHPCVDCGETDPVVLEFDHRKPADKKFTIGKGKWRFFDLEMMIEEIAKCDVRCANCHRRKTIKQREFLNHQNGSIRRDWLFVSS